MKSILALVLVGFVATTQGLVTPARMQQLAQNQKLVEVSEIADPKPLPHIHQARRSSFIQLQEVVDPKPLPKIHAQFVSTNHTGHLNHTHHSNHTSKWENEESRKQKNQKQDF